MTQLLTLPEYESLLRLAEPFVTRASGGSFDLPARIQRLLAALRAADRDSVPDVPGRTPRQALYAALISRPPRPFPPGFLEELDALLALEAAARPQVEAESLPRIGRGMALWKGDITTLRADAIVNAANSSLLGCFQPFHACIDNAIHAAAGPRLRRDCQAIMERQQCPEATGTAKLTRGYHLPARYVLHTVGPIYSGDPTRVSPAQREALAACYRSCLELAAAMPGIRSLALCCISTGVFGFPAQPAAATAVRTVQRWLDAHPGRLELVIWNVFSAHDEAIYRALLTRSPS